MNPVESFVISLARVSKRGSYHLRNLRSADRDDVLATALAWCWENRAQYTPSTTLEQWFDAALQEARSAWFGRGKRKKLDAVIKAKEFNEMMAQYIPDPIADAMEREQSINEILRQILPEERIEITAVMNGTRQRLSETLRRKLQRLKVRELLSGNSQFERKKTLRTLTATELNSLSEGKPFKRIDRQLEALSSPPKHGRDCPPCIHCDWWEFRYAPARTKHAGLADLEVRAAIADTLARKIAISSKVEHN